MTDFFRGKRILVTGGTGMVGIQLVSLLAEAGAKIRVASLEANPDLPADVEVRKANLLIYENCLRACEGMDMVFHVAGIKVSAGVVGTKPASVFVPSVLMNTNMIEAARASRVGHYLFTSSVGVYPPAERFFEDNVWTGMPSRNDWFGGWGKRVGELLVEAYQKEYGWNTLAIVRPANIYGPYDNFDEGSMVVPTLIRRVVNGEDPLVVWGDGSELRDFVHARDVARGMMIVMEHADGSGFNIGSGTGVSIRELVETICRCAGRPPRVEWDRSKKAGDRTRVLDITRAQGIGYSPGVSLEQGIAETVAWYRAHRTSAGARYNIFREGLAVTE